MNQPKTISFVATAELERLVKQWAAQDDRTVSATLRQILTQEAARRQARQNRQTPAVAH